MGSAATDVRNRFQIAMQNLQGNRHLRPFDLINGYKMFHPLRSLRDGAESFDVIQLAFDLFTRMRIHYEPHPLCGQSNTRAPTPVLASQAHPRVGLFVDSADHLSGVGITLSDWRAQARLTGHPLLVHTCTAEADADDMIAFPPIGSLTADLYHGLKLPIPSMDEVADYFKRLPCDVVHVSTPGPVGLLGLLAARQHGLPVCGTYHTDFPKYAATLTGDPAMEEAAWRFMVWFYGKLDRVAAPTAAVRRELVSRGIEAQKIHIVGRGVDTTRFCPSFRSEAWRNAHGPEKSLKLLYVGRLSREKNLGVLAQAFRQLTRTRPDIALVLVGDGPYRDELTSLLENTPAYFTGPLFGEDLATAYASSDLFVFPSLTDTYGRVVLEAQASGLPVLVSDQGGPQDAMIDGKTGMVVRQFNQSQLARAMDFLTNDPSLMARYGREARSYAATQSLPASFNAFWHLHEFSAFHSYRKEVAA